MKTTISALCFYNLDTDKQTCPRCSEVVPANKKNELSRSTLSKEHSDTQTEVTFMWWLANCHSLQSTSIDQIC